MKPSEKIGLAGVRLAGIGPAGIVLAISLLAAVPFAGGCSDRSRRLSEGEALSYKRQLLVENLGRVSPEQAERLGRHPGRTKGEIDQAFAELRREFEHQEATARAQLEASRKEGSGSSPGSVPGSTARPAEPGASPADAVK